jgi:hypothetical protein
LEEDSLAEARRRREENDRKKKQEETEGTEKDNDE